MFQYLKKQNVSIPMTNTPDTHFYNPSVKIGFISFSSSSDTQEFHHFLGCHAIGTNSLLIFFLSALRFLNLICLTKKLF